MAWELISETLILLCGGREQKEVEADLHYRERIQRKQPLDPKGTITPRASHSVMGFEACEQFVSGEEGL